MKTLITPIEVIAKANVDHNFDTKIVCSHIANVEFRYLSSPKGCFGDDFYNALVADVVDYIDYDSTVTYALDDIVIYGGAYYKCLANGTIGFEPTNIAKWVKVSKFTNSDYQELWDNHLWDFMAIATQHASTFGNAYRSTSKGIMRNDSDNSKPAEYAGVKALKDELMSTIMLVQERMDIYLKNNKDKFPLYKCNSECAPSGNKQSGTIGLYLKSKKRGWG
jgi:hypothetical protein